MDWMFDAFGQYVWNKVVLYALTTTGLLVAAGIVAWFVPQLRIWLLAAGLIVGAWFVGYWQGDRDGQAVVQVRWDAAIKKDIEDAKGARKGAEEEIEREDKDVVPEPEVKPLPITNTRPSAAGPKANAPRPTPKPRTVPRRVPNDRFNRDR